MKLKTHLKYLLVLIVGTAVGTLTLGLDANYRFIPQRFLLRTSYLLGGTLGFRLPGLDEARLPPVRVETEPGINLLLTPSDLVARRILVIGDWQPEVWRALSNGLSEGSVFLDVGAHIGYDTLKGSRKVGPAGKVIAFEPNPRTLEILRGNIAASHATNVVVQPIACTDKDETITLFDSTMEANSGASSLSLQTADSQRKGTLPSYQVRGRPIDDVVRELGLVRVDVIKMDVEGAETMVVRGARQTLLRFHPRVVTEVVAEHLKNLNSSVDELTALMAELGYTQHRPVDDTDWEWIVR